MTLKALRSAFKAEKNPIVLKKIIAVISYYVKIDELGLTKMKSYKVTAIENGMSVTTIRNYVRSVRKEGVNGLYRKPGSGRLRTYDRKMIKKAIEIIKKNGGRLTPRKLVNEVFRRCGRRMSKRHALRILHEMGMTAKKAQKVHVATAKPHEVYYWRKVVLPQLLALKKEGYAIGIGDAMIVRQDASGHQTYWSPPGETVKVPITGEGGRCVALGLTTEPDKNGVAHHCNVMHDAANTDAIIKLLKKAEAEFGLIALILDNAKSHKSDKLKDFIDKMENRIILFYLPIGMSYGSVQEANWRQTKLAEFYSDYFPNIKKKRRKTQRYLDTQLNPRLNMWKYLLRSPYAYRRNIKRRKNLHDKEGAYQHIVRKYAGRPVPKSPKRYAPLFADPTRVK